MSDNQSPVRNTIEHLKLCRKARAQGYPVRYTTDPWWLVNMAINRRAGWFDDPSEYRGSAMPVPVRQATKLGVIVIRLGKYPAKAQGREFMELWRLSRKLNSRIVTRVQEVPTRILARLSDGRLTEDWEY